MATPAEIQAEIDLISPTTRIIRSSFGATIDEHYVVGGIERMGRTGWCQTTAAETAEQQALAIMATLLG